MSVDTTEVIEQALQNPVSAAADGRSAQAHSLSEQIKAAQFLAAQTVLDDSDGDAWGAIPRRVGQPRGAV